MNTKQVIVIRKDLKMRTGKACAQASHASMSFITKGGLYKTGDTEFGYVETGKDFSYDHWIEVDHWLKNSFRKICVYVNSEQELDELKQKAEDVGLVVHLIIDNGDTEFKGVPTKTCLAIGPHKDEKFEGITDHLPLL
jgi:PTH2 family peptidyl-tRNA hydrolase